MATTAAEPAAGHFKTQLSATYPSEIPSPMDAAPSTIKLEDGSVQNQKTPITPPAAYLDFLKTFSPTVTSPHATEQAALLPRPATLSSVGSSDTVVTLSSDAASDAISSTSGLSRTTSAESHASINAPAGAGGRKSPPSRIHLRRDSLQETPNSTAKPALKKISIPPSSPFVRPHSAKAPRPLHIPASSPSTASLPSAGLRTPLSASSLRTPLSAHSLCSPYRLTTLSPIDGAYELKSPYAGGQSIKAGNVSVRQVVTRTVMYSHSSKPAITATTATAPVVEPASPYKKRKTE